MRRAADLYRQAGDVDSQFIVLTAWAGYVGAEYRDDALHLIDEAATLLPALRRRKLRSLHNGVVFWLAPSSGLPPWPDDRYEQRLVRLQQARAELGLDIAAE